MAEKKKSARKETSKKKVSTKKEKVCETFEIEKGGKEKTVKICGQESVKVSTPDQIKYENKLLRNILLALGVIVLGFFIVLVIYYSMSHFEFEGVKYNILNEKTITFYHTNFPSNFVSSGKTVDFNVYLRNDPRELNNIPFEGNINLLEMAVIDSKDNFDCEGDGVIAIANFNQIMKAIGVEVIKDPEYSQCDASGRYMFFNLKSGDETKIVQTGPACYDFEINDCEVLQVTERFLTKSISAIQ